MLKLQMFGPAFGLPDPSPFAMKGEMLLKLAGLDYSTEVGDVRKAPKGKMPVLLDGDTAIPDSTFIRFHLEDNHGIDFDKGLSARERGIAWSVEKMLEESLYFAVMHERWAIDENFDRGPRMFFDSIPAPVRGLLVGMIRKQVKRNLWGQGTGRHSRAEICRLAARMLTSLSDVMGDNKYLMGSRACGADASVFPFVAGSLCPVFESEVLAHARSHKNLVDYYQRMMAEFYPDLKLDFVSAFPGKAMYKYGVDPERQVSAEARTARGASVATAIRPAMQTSSNKGERVRTKIM